MTPELTSRIDLGHIIQAGVLLVTVLGGVGGVYLTVQGRISAISESNAAQQQQIIQLTQQVQRVRDEQKDFAKDNGTALEKIGNQLTDLRVLVAGMRDGRKQ